MRSFVNATSGLTLLHARAAGLVRANALARSSVSPCEPLIVITMSDTTGPLLHASTAGPVRANALAPSGVSRCEPLIVISMSDVTYEHIYNYIYTYKSIFI